MQLSARTYLTSGVAALGAGVIALSPVQPLPQHMALAQQPAIQNMAVSLASTIDPITPIVNTVTTTLGNIGALAKLSFQQPLPFISTVAANLLTYFNELTTGNAGLIPGQITNNIKTLFTAAGDFGDVVVFPAPPLKAPQPVSKGDYASTTAPVPNVINSPEALNGVLIQLYGGNFIDDPCQLDGICLVSVAAPITNFLNSPASAAILGLLGPILSPIAQLSKSINAIVSSLKGSDLIGAINSLINIPTNLVNSFLNGAGLVDVTSLLSKFVSLPPEQVEAVTLNLGGLLNVVPQAGLVSAPTRYSGGVGLDAMGLVVPGGTVFATGFPIGAISSILGTGQFIASKMRVTAPVKSAQSVRAAATAALAESTDDAAPSASDARDAADAPSAGTSEAPANAPAPTRGTSRAKAATGYGDSHAATRARRGAA